MATIQDQKKLYGWRYYRENGTRLRIRATVRHDDQCGNGHNSFSVTGEIQEARGGYWKEYTCGCIHEDISRHFPGLIPAIRFHLFSTDGPMHYPANAIYHASDKDCWGLQAGGFRSFTFKVMTGKTELFNSRVFYSFRNWLHRKEAREAAESFLAHIRPELNPVIKQVGSGAASEGKPPDLDAARSCAAWPGATLEQLKSESLLLARLPQLLKEFRALVESLGLTY